jgi:hypothetical protein
MTLALYLFVAASLILLGYMLGVSDGKVEGRIEAFQDKR